MGPRLMGDNQGPIGVQEDFMGRAFVLGLIASSLLALPAVAADKNAQKGAAGSAISAGQQCLNSFKDGLKDPESGKVLRFKEPVLTYTATNTYGGRIQGKALCKQGVSGWERDRLAEMSQAMEAVTAVASAEHECVNSGKAQCTQAGPHSLAEALRSLGFD
jgi:hypothetical protein